jgi:hypothetical protein
MGKTILMLMAVFAIISCDFVAQPAFADEMVAMRHSQCGPHKRCFVRRWVGCPDRYSCYSLYGAYGPWGGPAYWSRYSYGGYYAHGGWGFWR